VQEDFNGVKIDAVNLWRPSALNPVPAIDDDVKPYREHAAMLLGPEGSPAYEHFMNYAAFLIQKPGAKINHAPVLLGEEGIGKDTLAEKSSRVHLFIATAIFLAG
jgi:hypothetical protein